MANPFERMALRMDNLSLARMGKPTVINGSDYLAVPSEALVEMGAVNGNQVCLVIFSEDYLPRRNDNVIYEGLTFTVTRHDRFNGKPRIYLE